MWYILVMRGSTWGSHEVTLSSDHKHRHEPCLLGQHTSIRRCKCIVHGLSAWYKPLGDLTLGALILARTKDKRSEADLSADSNVWMSSRVAFTFISCSPKINSIHLQNKIPWVIWLLCHFQHNSSHIIAELPWASHSTHARNGTQATWEWANTYPYKPLPIIYGSKGVSELF